MASYTITFRIHENQTYQQRYKSFIDEAKKGGIYWADPTSFFAVNRDESIDALAHRLDANTLLQPDKDMFLIMDADVKSAVVWGHVIDRDVFKIIPYLRAV